MSVENRKIKILVGMTRPPWDEISGFVGNWICPCTAHLSNQSIVYQHYAMGHFDIPQHVEVEREELLKQIIDKAAKRLVNQWLESSDRKELYAKYNATDLL